MKNDTLNEHIEHPFKRDRSSLTELHSPYIYSNFNIVISILSSAILYLRKELRKKKSIIKLKFMSKSLLDTFFFLFFIVNLKILIFI